MMMGDDVVQEPAAAAATVQSATVGARQLVVGQRYRLHVRRQGTNAGRSVGLSVRVLGCFQGAGLNLILNTTQRIAH